MITIEENSLIPIADKLMVRPLNNESRTKTGIIIPDSAKNPMLIGEVLAAGPGRHSETGKLIPMEVKAGDTVFYGRYAGSEVKTSTDQLVILMAVDDVLARIEKQDAPRFTHTKKDS